MTNIISTMGRKPPVPSMEEHHASMMAAFEESANIAAGEQIAESQFDLIDAVQAEGGDLVFTEGNNGSFNANIRAKSGNLLDVSELLQAGCPVLRVKNGQPYAQWNLESINSGSRTKLVLRGADGGRTNFSSDAFGHVDEQGNGWFFDTAQLRAMAAE